MRNTYYLPDIIVKNILKTMNTTKGRTSPKPSPPNMLLISPVILGFEDNEDNQNHEQPEQNRKRNSKQLAEKIYQV